MLDVTSENDICGAPVGITGKPITCWFPNCFPRDNASVFKTDDAYCLAVPIFDGSVSILQNFGDIFF